MGFSQSQRYSLTMYTALGISRYFVTSTTWMEFNDRRSDQMPSLFKDVHAYVSVCMCIKESSRCSRPVNECRIVT